MNPTSKQQLPKRKIETSTLTDGDVKRPRVGATEVDSEAATSSSLLQSLTTANQPTLTLHGTQLEVTIDEVLVSNKRIALASAQNFVGPQQQHSCILKTMTQSKEKVWSTTVFTHIKFLRADSRVIVMASQLGELFCYSIMSGTILLSLRLNYPVLNCVLNKQYCAVQQTNKQISIWDLEQGQQVRTYRLDPLLEKELDFSLAQTGQPIVFLNNGEVWFFSERQSMWRQIRTSIDMLTSLITYLDFIQRAVTNGLISKISINRKNLKPGSVASMMVAETAEEEQLELLLAALDEMDYIEEYRLLSCVYVSRLVSRGKTRRLYTYKQILSNLPTESKVDVEAVQNEIDDLLTNYPIIKQELDDLPAQMIDELYVEEDLGFLV